MPAFISTNMFNIILKFVNIHCPNKRKPKYSNAYYLTNILDLLTDFHSYRSLQKSINYNGTSKHHFKTINDKHLLWSKV